MSDTPPRDEPEFGAYATPEEQRRRMGLPAEAPKADTPPAVPSASAAPVPHDDAQRGGEQQTPGRLLPTPGSLWNRVFTFFFLGIGLYTVITTVPGVFRLTETLNTTLAIAYDTDPQMFQRTAVLTGLGVAIGTSYIVAWTIALWLSLREMRASKKSWWIPLVVGVAVTVLGLILLTAAVASQPDVLMEFNEQILNSGVVPTTET